MNQEVMTGADRWDSKPSLWTRLRAIVTGMLVVALAVPATAVMAGYSAEPMLQSPPASLAEWDDAVAAVNAGLSPADAIDYRNEEIRKYVAWLSATWECVFGRTPAVGETAPFVDSTGPLADGVYILQSWTGEVVSIELLLTANSTRDEMLDLIPAGASLHPAVQHAGQAMAWVIGSDCVTELHVLIYHLVVADEHRNCIVPVSDISAELFDSMKQATSIAYPETVEPVSPVPHSVCDDEDPCASNARGNLDWRLQQAKETLSNCKLAEWIGGGAVLAGCATVIFATSGLAILLIGAGCAGAIAAYRVGIRQCYTNANQSIADAWAQFRQDLMACGHTPDQDDGVMYRACYAVDIE